jgi:site-specific DNA-methyltransferase (adenine-specific)
MPAVPWHVERADCLDFLPSLDAESNDVVITDSPYGIDFHGERWDGQAIDEAADADSEGRPLSRPEAFQLWVAPWATECHRVLRPGSWIACFAAPRMAHRLACGLEDAGFEVRDTLMWMFGTGMPKSRDRQHGQRSDLKPGFEPLILARKPLEGSLGENLSRHGTGALNIDACRAEDSDWRYPANVVFSHLPECGEQCVEGCPVVELDACAQLTRQAGASAIPASRFFYCPKASTSEREEGCEGLPRRELDLFPGASAKPGRQTPNDHPTVKPLALMRWLIRLLSPEGGSVLDPFTGSGSTGCAAVIEGRHFIGIERESRYAAIARARIAHFHDQPLEQSQPGRLSPGKGKREPGHTSALPGQSTAKPRHTSAKPGHRSAKERHSAALPRHTSALPGHSPAMRPAAEVVLASESVEAIAQQVAERLGQSPAAPETLLSADEVAIRYGVERSWVYEHADQLGAIRLGNGPRPRLRFKAAQVEDFLAGESAQEQKAATEADAGRLAAIPADSAPLLPIRGTQS